MPEEDLVELVRVHTAVARGPWAIGADTTIVRLAHALLEAQAEIARLRAALLRAVADRRYQEDHGGAGASLYDTFGRGDPWPGVKGIAEYEAEAREELGEG